MDFRIQIFLMYFVFRVACKFDFFSVLAISLAALWNFSFLFDF
jgi:hypothetical protein